MRMLTILLIAMAILFIARSASAKDLTDPGGSFVRHKTSKLGKDYYLVREGGSNQCSVVTGTWEKKPEGAIGGAPYASKEYAMAALKTFAECKGGEADEDESKHKKK
jgi:hypothetical protein